MNKYYFVKHKRAPNLYCYYNFTDNKRRKRNRNMGLMKI